MGQTLSGKIKIHIFKNIICFKYNVEPVTSKNSQKVENPLYSVGSSSMQGWRISKFSFK
jgi:hypothetical protein